MGMTEIWHVIVVFMVGLFTGMAMPLLFMRAVIKVNKDLAGGGHDGS